MKKEHLFSIIFLLIIWQVSAIIVNNDIFVPLPVDVFKTMLLQIQEPKFLLVIGGTLKKTFISFGLSLVLGVVFGLISSTFKLVEKLLAPINTLLTAIPNISYMFILLLCFSSNTAVYFIVFFIIFPIIYNATLNGVKAMDQDLKDVLKVYDETILVKMFNIYYHQALPYVKACTFSTITLGLKVCIMSEVLGQVKYGIGKEMYLNKINLDMSGVFSWTIWVILLVFVIEKALSYIFNYFDN